MDTAQWPEGIGVVKSMEEKKTTRPQKPQALNCPRCNSTHTKFCYYNNYSLSQPRYFCKTCRRYWTEGGSLRNVPVGGGSRKNKRSSSSSSASISSSSTVLAAAAAAGSSIPKFHHHHMMMAPPAIPSLISQNPSKSIIPNLGGHGQDLNLAYPNVSNEFVDLPYSNKTYHPNTTTTTTTSSSPSQFSAMEFLKSTGIGNPRGMIMNSFMSMPITDSNNMIMNSPGLNFSLDGLDQNGGGYHHHHQHHHHDNNNNNNTNGATLQGGNGVISHQETNSTTTTTTSTSASARLFFPFEDLKTISTSASEVVDPNRGGQGDSSNGYWNGGLGGGGSW